MQRVLETLNITNAFLFEGFKKGFWYSLVEIKSKLFVSVSLLLLTAFVLVICTITQLSIALIPIPDNSGLLENTLQTLVEIKSDNFFFPVPHNMVQLM